jgi:flagellar hook-associated protein 2
MISGMDTESIIQSLMSAQSMKKTKIENNQTKLNWKQEIWSDLNKKLYSLYTGKLSKARLQGNYSNKKVTASDESKATITASTTAAAGSHSLGISKLASAQYLTGDVIKSTDGSKVTSATSLSSLGITEGTVITVKGGVGSDNEKSIELEVTAGTTINDFVNKCKEAGLNASFDATQGRLFINSSQSGTDQKFTITTGVHSDSYNQAVQNLKSLTGYSNVSNTATLDAAFSAISASDADKLDKAFQIARGEIADDRSDSDVTALVEHVKKVDEAVVLAKAKELTAQELKDGIYTELKQEKLNTYYTDKAKEELTKEWLNSSDSADWIAENYPDGVPAEGEEGYDEYLSKAKTAYAASGQFSQDAVDAKVAEYQADAGVVAEAEATLDEDALQTEALEKARTKVNSGENSARVNELVAEGSANAEIADALTQIKAAATTYVTDSGVSTIGGDSLLKKVGLDEITGTGVSNMKDDGTSGLVVVEASDAVFTLDGATMVNSNNEFTINGLSMNLTALTDPATPMTFTVSNDTDATYKMIKEFVKEFDDVLGELNDYYYADSARDYDVLSEDEKEAMSDEEVEKWEKKIKDSLLRRDTTLESLTNAMKSALMGSIKIDGKSYSLASLGIQTSSDFMERGKLHIYGDEDDEEFSAETNKLKNMLESDPDIVSEIMSNMAKNLYKVMTDKMATSSLSSALTFYNDKSLKKQDTQYKQDIKDWEKKLADIEDRYYKQFTAMEKALSKLQNQQNSLASMMGMGTG